MFNKIFTLFLVLSVCFTLTAQQYEESPFQSNNDGQNAIWDLLFSFDVTLASGGAGNAGAEFDGTSYYTTRWASNLIHEYDAAGVMIREFSIPGVTGLRDLAYDGTYFYGGASGSTIYQMDFATGTLIGTIPVSGVTVRNIAYDEGSDGFWCGNWSDPVTLFDRSGTQLDQIVTSLTGQYGSAYDNVSPGGPFLWVFDQGVSQAIIHQFDIATGTATGITYDAGPDAIDPTIIAGGLWTSTDHTPGFMVIGGLGQGVPDEMLVWELAPAGGPVTTFTDNFDTYTAGTQLVSQNPVDWDTWTGGGGTAEDPFVSDAYSFSGANSVVVVGTSGAANDFIRRHGDLTTGKWYMSFAFYIPAGHSGYFNTMNDFDVATVWGMDCYFDVGGTGRVDTTGGGGVTFNVPFTWVEDQWNQVVVTWDLDASPPVAEVWTATNPSNLTMIATWDFTQAGTKPLQLAVNDFFGAATTDEMYMDDYYFGDAMPPIIPVELTSFTANVNHSGQVELNWSTASELNNQLFEIERRTEAGQFATIGYVEGHGTTTETQHYSYTDATVSSGIYFYRLKQLDFLGSYEYFDEIEVDVNGPLTFDLEQNYPNPFNPSTNIKYSVPETGDIRLSVYNLIGEEVAVLVDGFSEAGFFEVTFNASSLPSGAYFYKLQSGNSVVAKKMLLMK